LLRLVFRHPRFTVSSAAGPYSLRQTTPGTDRATPESRTTKSFADRAIGSLGDY
jgi:hypothetical protein